MRIRQIKPSYWTDARMHRLGAATRELYIGLWMLADDAGWLRWDIEEIGAELYRYVSARSRERAIERMAAALVEEGRIVIHDCGHACVPTLGQHQRLSGPTKQVRTFINEHERRCLPLVPAVSRTSPHIPDTERNVIGKVGNGSRAGAGPSGSPAPGKEAARRAVAGLRPVRLLGELMPVAASAALALEDEP